MLEKVFSNTFLAQKYVLVIILYAEEKKMNELVPFPISFLVIFLLFPCVCGVIQIHKKRK